MTAASPREAEQLTLAYGRFVELHGRALIDPRSGCSVTRLAGNGAETRIFTFWSARAADEFDFFWARYKPVYAAPPARSAGTSRRSGRVGVPAHR